MKGYAWGYGAPFLAEGQLSSPDPGCGEDDIYQVQISQKWEYKPWTQEQASNGIRESCADIWVSDSTEGRCISFHFIWSLKQNCGKYKLWNKPTTEYGHPGLEL